MPAVSMQASLLKAMPRKVVTGAGGEMTGAVEVAEVNEFQILLSGFDAVDAAENDANLDVEERNYSEVAVRCSPSAGFGACLAAARSTAPSLPCT
mmetsp:Transcript_18089/g.55372  ORF Transcript_18089/g.55372 Transcript_18089/m.55372 type:complete len:95 (-) Transcript_18089:564-848(-)